MIESVNMFEDLRSDKVGLAIMALRSMDIWNKEKHSVRRTMDKTMVDAGYQLGTGTAAQYRLTFGMGFSYLYLVPPLKRGRFALLRGQLIRIVYTYSGKNIVHFMYAPVQSDQRGRSYLSMASESTAPEVDVRHLYHFAYGEPAYKGPSDGVDIKAPSC
jgi:hypothetical protein